MHVVFKALRESVWSPTIIVFDDYDYTSLLSALCTRIFAQVQLY